MARDNVLHPQQKQFFQMALPEIFEGLTHSIADSEETIPGKEVARIAALEMSEVRALCDAGILAFGFERGTSETRQKFLKWQAEELGSCLRRSEVRRIGKGRVRQGKTRGYRQH